MKREGGVLVGIGLIVVAVMKALAHDAPAIVHNVPGALHDLSPVAAHALAMEAAPELRISITVLEPWIAHAAALPNVDAAAFTSAAQSARQQARSLDSLADDIRLIAEQHGLTSRDMPQHLKSILHGSVCDAMSDFLAGKEVDPTDVLRKNGLLRLLGEEVEAIALASDTGKNLLTSVANGRSPSQAVMAARLSIECALAGRTA